MAIEQGIWKIGARPQKLKPAALADETLLEEQVMHDIAILNPDWLLIGRQVRPPTTSTSTCWQWTPTAR